MTQDEKTLQESEDEFPSLSGAAFSNAFRKTLNSGLSVLVSDGDFIYEVFPDGTRKRVKKIDPRSPVERGKKIPIR